MKEQIERKTHIIDARNKVLGRLAVKIAVLLTGKNKTIFVRNRDVGDFVVIKNIKQLKFTGNKVENKIYYRHSGYLGNLKEITLGKMFEKTPDKVLWKAVWGMLPKNRLRKEYIKKLKIEL